MSETKFKYYYKHKKDGDIQTEIFTLDEIEMLHFDTGFLPQYYHIDDGYEFLAREQFTGLTDKNGVEIFCGDILKVNPIGDETEKTLHKVNWCGKEYPAFDLRPSLDEDSNGLSSIMCGGYLECVVIGNIYQNKDLLNDSN